MGKSCTTGGNIPVNRCGQWKTVWRFLKELKIELPYNLAILLLDIYLKETKSLSGKETCTPMFIAALLTIAKTWKQSRRPPIGE